ncbi:MAG: hypothetical protein PHE29_03755 [Tissierellia bacterium]|nr:hypothetical protein [Tissierellia bacterium]MDD4780502.1 hypothetical protein [Tissierellia bacterium]
MKFLMVIIIIIGGLLFIYINIKVKFKIVLNLHNATIVSNIVLFKKNVEIIRNIDYKFIFRIFFYDVGNVKAPHKNYLKYFKSFKYFKKIFRINNLSLHEECLNNNRSLAIEFNIVNKFNKKPLLSDLN